MNNYSSSPLDPQKVNVNVNLNLNFKAAESANPEIKRAKRTPRRTLKTDLVQFKEDEFKFKNLGKEKYLCLELEGKSGDIKQNGFFKKEYSEEITIVNDSPISQTINKNSQSITEEEEIQYEDYFKIKSIESYPDLIKTVDLEFLAQCGNKLKEMVDNLEKKNLRIKK